MWPSCHLKKIPTPLPKAKHTDDDFVSEPYLPPSILIQLPCGFFEVVRNFNVVLPMYSMPLRCFLDVA